MKKCKDCGETDIDKLHQQPRGNKILVYNCCKFCWAEKVSKFRLGKTLSEEQKKNIGIANAIALKGRKFSKEHKTNLCIALRGRKMPSVSSETKKKLRESAIKYIEENHFGGLPMMPRVGKNETKILNEIENKLNIKLERQYKVCGYFLDGYDKQNNVVYEVDEDYHLEDKQQERDKLRQEDIMKELNCEWVSIADRSIEA